jgi:phosphosulfolactate phosphohydrolase-like enzyme
VLVADHEQALAMKRRDPSLFLTGEIGGRPISGFDAGNSPSAIEGLDLCGRRVVQRTSSGTQGVVAAENADEILLGSFVIAEATVRYLRAGSGDVTVGRWASGGGPGAARTTCASYTVSARLRESRRRRHRRRALAEPRSGLPEVPAPRCRVAAGRSLRLRAPLRREDVCSSRVRSAKRASEDVGHRPTTS